VCHIHSLKWFTCHHLNFLKISLNFCSWRWRPSPPAHILHNSLLFLMLIFSHILMLQVRVQKETCVARDRMPSWVMGDTCYPPYSAYTNDKKPMRVSNLTVPYTKVASTAETVLHGRLTHYGGSGTRFPLPVGCYWQHQMLFISYKY